MRASGQLVVASSLVVAGVALTSCQTNTASLPCAEAPVAATATAVPATPEVIAGAELHNPSEFPRQQEAVFFSHYDLGLASSDPRTKILAAMSGTMTLPSQTVDRDGDGELDSLLVHVDFAAAETKTLTFVADAELSAVPLPKLTQAEFSHKVGGAWQPRKAAPKRLEYVGGSFQNVQAFTAPPEHTDQDGFIRYEGPGLESDRVGYRFYFDARNGFDIFGKKTPAPALQNVGLDGFESYHHMADWGMDILKVGTSLGAGAFGTLKDGKIQAVSDVKTRSVAITDNGSIYSSIRLGYGGWQVDGKEIDLSANISMTAGSRLAHVRLTASKPLSNLVLGVVKHADTELLQGNLDIPNDAWSYLGSWGKQSLAGDSLGMAVLFKERYFGKRLEDANNYAAVFESPRPAFDYYLVAAWQGEPGGIQTKEQFVTYLEQEAERLTMPVRRRLKTAADAQRQPGPMTGASALSWAQALADSELERKTLRYVSGGWDPNRGRPTVFGYDVVGLQPLAYDELAKEVADPRYAEVMPKITGSYISEDGSISSYNESSYNIDNINAGKNLLRLYERTGEEKYKKAAATLRRQLRDHPKTSEGAFWHKKIYPYQLWLDGVYMGLPFLTHYSTLFEKGESYKDVVREFELARKYLRDPATGLYFHAWDEKKTQKWADPKTGRSTQFWSRGIGWFAMALVDVLELLPANATEQRAPLLAMVQELAPALARVQDPETGTWWQILDKPGATGNYRESSGSVMFAYFFAKATRLGYLHATYGEVARRSFEGVVKEFTKVHPDGKVSMTNQCYVGGLGFGRDGSYKYYLSEPISRNDAKGLGPFIMAGVELHRLLK